MTPGSLAGNESSAVIAGRFALTEELNRTVVSRVFVARSLLPPWPDTVLKILVESASDTERAQFRKRYKLMARLKHVNLMPVAHLFEDSECHWIGYAMPRIVPWQLHTPVKNLNRFLSIAKALCSAVDYLHRSGYLAGTLSLDQLLFSGDPLDDPSHLRLINYGFAADSDGFSEISRIREISRLAPEVIHGAIETLSIDLYGLGVLLYELATGHCPFTGTVGQIIKKHLNETPPPPELDPGVDRIIGRLLAKEPHMRFAAAQDVLAEFDRIATHRPTSGVMQDLLQGETLLTGRETEMERIEAGLTDAESTGRSAVVCVEGLFGAGKSRVIREISALQSSAGWIVLPVRSRDDLAMIESWLRDDPQPKVPVLICQDSDEVFADLFRSVGSWRAGSSGRRVHLLVEIPAREILREHENGFSAPPEACVVHLDRLPDEKIARIVGSYLYSSSPPGELTESIRLLSAGYPLFIESSLRFLHRSGALEFEEEWVFHQDRVPRNQYPPLITEYIQDLLAFIGTPLQALLLEIAACGEAATLPILDRIAKPGYNSILDRGIRLGILKQASDESAAESPIRFAHPAIPRLLIQRADSDALSRLYARIARALSECGWEGELPARMFLECGQVQDAAVEAMRAVTGLMQTGDQNKAYLLLRDFESVLDDLSPAMRRSILTALAGIELDRGHGSLAMKYCDQIDPEPLGPETASLYRIRAQVLIDRCEFSQAMHVLREAASIGGLAEADCAALVLLEGRLNILIGRMDEARSAADRLNRMASHPSTHSVVRRFQTIMNALIDCVEGCRGKAILALEDALAGDSTDPSRLGLMLAELLLDSGRYKDASAVLDRIAREREHPDSQPERALWLRIRAGVSLHQLELNAAEDFLEQAINIDVRCEQKLEEQKALILRAQVRLARGRIDQARDELTDILGNAEAMGCITLAQECRTALVQVMLDNADYEAARYHIDRCIQSVEESEYRYLSVRLRILKASLYWMVNMMKEVHTQLAPFQGASPDESGVDTSIQSLILLSHCARLERQFSTSHTLLRTARDAAEQCGAIKLQVWIELAQIRLTIDSDLSDSVWYQTVNIWDRLKRLPDMKLKLETGLVISKLAFRRGDIRNASRILDSSLGIARHYGYREHLWRGMRMMAQILYSQRLTSQTFQILTQAREVLGQILAAITSREISLAYQNRPDVQATQLMFEDLEQIHRTHFDSGESFPVVSIEEGVEPIRIGLLGERYRLYHQAARAIRAQTQIDKILDLLVDTGMKLSGAFRGIAVLLDERGVERTSRRCRFDTPDYPIQALLGSAMVRDALDSKECIVIRDTRSDARYPGDPFLESLLPVSLLCIPCRSRMTVPGVICLESGIEEAGPLRENGGLIQDLADEAALAIESARMYSEQNEVFLGVVRALSAAVDAKDPYTFGHSSRVSHYARLIATELGMGHEDLRKLELAALLHDIGKIGISQAILDSPNVLNPDEKRTVSFHPEIGAQILAPIKKFKRIWTAVYQHHERYDGKGYPHGLRGSEIELFGRILAVADALDAMTTNRPYQKAKTVAAATDQLRIHSGTQFDPEIVATVERMLVKGTLQPANPDRSPSS